MEKIIYNNKLRKLCAVILMLVILINVLAPVAIAADTIIYTECSPGLFYYKNIEDKDCKRFEPTNEDGKDEKYWDKDTYILSENSINLCVGNYGSDSKDVPSTGINSTFLREGYYKYNEELESMYGSETLENAVKKAAQIACDYVNDSQYGADDLVEDVEEVVEEVKEVVEPKAVDADNEVKYSQEYDEEGNLISVNFMRTPKEEWKDKYDDETFNEAKLTQKDFAPWFAEGGIVRPEHTNIWNEAIITYNDSIDEAREMGYDVYDSVIYANGEAKEVVSDGLNEYVESIKDSADLGGILLSPVFYLVNFIADAITANIGRIMLGQSLNLTSGIGILVTKANYDQIYKNIEVEQTDPYEVDIGSFLFESYQYPNIQYTPEEIFSGQVDLLSIDFISGKSIAKDENGNIIRDENGNIVYTDNPDTGWQSIRKVISEWYKVIRMIAIIGLLSVLIYTGIKIIISANAKDKAKYKEWIINWFMAVAILFFMHYIMAFIISVTGELNVLLSNSTKGINVVLVDNGQPVTDENGEQVSFVTNLMGLVRFMIQSEDFYIKVGYEVMYIALIVYTVKFTITYLKRVLNMAFLTLIAPIVALTYPIDKLNDGKAQGFDMWLKEYIFNALLQPMHFVLYYILVGAAVGIAASNPLYGIVVLAFMTEAERLLKKIFGFDKAGGGTVGGMAGAFAAGAIASNVKNIAKMAGGKGGNGGSGADGDSDNNILESAKSTKDNKENSFFGNTIAGESAEQPSLGRGNNSEDNESSKPNNHDNEEVDEDNKAKTSFFENDDDPDMRDVYGQPDSHGNEEVHKDNDGKTEMPNENNGKKQTDAAEPKNDQNPKTKLESKTEEANDQNPETKPKPKKKKEQSNFAKGMISVGKAIAKPVWDFDKGGKYNGKRLTRKIAKGVVGAGIGITAAAVQAGISITDGKYNPMEGMATFAAGMAGGGQIVKKAENMGNTFMDGYTSGDKDAQMKRAKEAFRNNDKVIAHYKREYGDDWKTQIKRASDNYVTQGIKDTGEQKRCMKFANEMKERHPEWSVEQADRWAGDTLDFRNTLKEQGQLAAVNDLDKRKKYIEAMCEGKDEATKEIIRAQYNNAFDAVRDYNDIVYK